jgi:hypothetical protein
MLSYDRPDFVCFYHKTQISFYFHNLKKYFIRSAPTLLSLNKRELLDHQELQHNDLLPHYESDFIQILQSLSCVMRKSWRR